MCRLNPLTNEYGWWGGEKEPRLPSGMSGVFLAHRWLGRWFLTKNFCFKSF